MSGQTRTDELRKCFRWLDKDNTGLIAVEEARALARQAAQQAELPEPQRFFPAADSTHKQHVSLQEFADVMLALTEPLSDMQFTQFTNTALGQEPHTVHDTTDYHHPKGSRQWLAAEVGPVLQQGLLQLAEEAVQQRLQLAAGSEWHRGTVEGEGGDSDTDYMPHGWRPFQPLRWLGEWLGGGPPPELPIRAGSPSCAGPSFGSLTREQKVGLAFKHLDTDCNGGLDVTELLAMAGKVQKDRDLTYAQELLAGMDINEDGRVDAAEYCRFMMTLTEVLTDVEFDAAIHRVLGARHLSQCVTVEDKLRFLFHELDSQGAGVVAEGAVVQTALRLAPAATPWSIQGAMEVLAGARRKAAQVDQRPTTPLDAGQVDVEAFVSILSGLLVGVTDAELEELIASLVQGRKLGTRLLLDSGDPLDEVQPQRFRELLQSLPQPEHLVQIGTSDVIDSVDGDMSSPGATPFTMLDLRPMEQWAVSTLPGALHLPLQEAPDTEEGWALPELQPLREVIGAALADTGRPPRLVAFCATGQTAGPASVLLGKTLGITVRNLCGGIINYYNQGGRVRDPSSQREVQAVHPGSLEYRAYITRPSSYKLTF